MMINLKNDNSFVLKFDLTPDTWSPPLFIIRGGVTMIGEEIL